MEYLIYLIPIILAICFLYFLILPFYNLEKWDRSNAQGLAVVVGFLGFLIFIFIALGDALVYSKQYKEQAERYEKHMIDGTFKIGYDNSYTIINGDTTNTNSEPYIILEN